MRRDEVEGRLNEVFHILFIAMSLPLRQSLGRGSESISETRNYNENRVFAAKRPLRRPGLEL